jgi:gliding motility-associated-like protein
LKPFKNIAQKTLFLFLSFLGVYEAHAQMEFVENKGQWDSKVNFRGDFTNGSFFVEKAGFTVLIHNSEDLETISEKMHGHSSNDNEQAKSQRTTPIKDSDDLTLRSHAYKVNFLNASPRVEVIPEKAQASYNNYFIGNDKTKWAADCKIFQAITYKNIYPNIDVRYYSDAGKLKYDIIVHPGGDVGAIVMRYDGVDKLEVKNKELIIQTSVGDVKELYPYSYQVANGKRQTIDCKYSVRNNIVKFKADDFDAKSTLVIDPTVVFCSFTGSTADNWGYTATPGPDGSFFAGGIAFASGYPASPGAFQTAFGGGAYDIAVFKFSPNGSSRLYATYIGGIGNEQPHSMICDAQGNLVVAGRSSSNNYPITRPQIGVGGNYDIVITKLNANGTAIIGSIKMGGSGNDGVNIGEDKGENKVGAVATRRNYGDDARSEVILDGSNNIYLASCSQSNDFPVTPGAVQPFLAGGQDGIVAKFTPNLANTLFATYFGGSGDDACFVASLNPVNGDLYVAGGTTSNNLPGNKTGVLSPAYRGGKTDGFIAQLLNDGSSLVRVTYQGTSGNDLVYGIQFDKIGFPYIMGTTTGNWAIQNVKFSNPGGKQFISKLKPDLSAYVYSTVFGTNSAVPNLSPVAFLVDRCENVYVSGWGDGSANSPYPSAGTFGLPQVNPLAGFPAADGSDFYFFVLEKNAQSQFFGSHFGQNGGFGDHVDGGTSRFDANGVIYQAICANCRHQAIFPTTPGVWSGNNKSANCNQAAVKISMNFAGVGAGLKTEIDGVPYDTVGCMPLTVKFIDTLIAGKTYYWDFGDGTVDTTKNGMVSHSFMNVGTFTIRLIKEDSVKCNIRDTAYRTIKVGTNKAFLDFSFVKIGDCNDLDYRFINTSKATIGNFSDKGFVWDWGDGSPKDTVSSAPIEHTFPAAGSYKVRLCVIDTFICNAPDCVDAIINVTANVKAQFVTPAVGCAPYKAMIKNTSLGGTIFTWDFGDGTTSDEVSPTHLYSTAGVYTVKLIVEDPNTCNKIDSAFFNITVSAKPIAGFTWEPNPLPPNTAVQFSNTSQGAIKYIWKFGDGDTSTQAYPTHLFNSTGTFKSCLIAINQFGCTDTFCLDIPIIINPLLDVPTAFTPGKPTNGIIKVEGFGIGKMSWKIYNRWGQVVFETANRQAGWDGTFKGALQPQDVYTYSLDVEFTDGKKIRKTGDITLIR